MSQHYRIFLYCLFCICFVLFNSSTSRRFSSQRSLFRMEIAPFKKPRVQNVPGNLFVDESCIDCDVCRWMCPSIYSRKGIKSIVQKQPMDEVACPVGSIRTRLPDPLAKVATELFPLEIDPDSIPGVFHLGYHSSLSFGATPYLVRLKSGNNVMVDCPRFNSRLASSIQAEGGLRYIVLTHMDDVADHAKWRERFPGAERIIHKTDVLANTQDCEIQLEGGGEWFPEADFRLVHTPGHTAGSICVEVKTMKDTVLFTGDHLAYSASKDALTGFKQYNHGNPQVQADSMRLLAEEDFAFTWIIPGHGRIARFESREECCGAVLRAADAFDAEDDQDGVFGLGYR